MTQLLTQLGIVAFAIALAATPALPAAESQPGAGKDGGASAASGASPSRYKPARFAGRAGMYYRAVWGIDSLVVRLAESDEVVRFSWRVLDPVKASMLSDKRLEPSLIDQAAGVSLVVPAMEKIGKLRQSAPPETGKKYWMVFSNKGRYVKRGDRVDVVIGQFRAPGLVVD